MNGGVASPSPRMRGEGRGEGLGDWPRFELTKPLTLTLSPQAVRGDSTGKHA
jgi:hypothetical protein